MINMKKNIYNFYSFFKVLIYLIFVFSGSFKWIPLPLDLTIFSGLICFVIILFEINNINRFNFFWDKCLIFLLFFLNVFFLFSNIYSISEVYASSKNLSIILNLFTVIYPIVVFDESIFNTIKRIYLGLGITITFLLFVLYLNDMFIIFHDSNSFMHNVPTYLIISITLSTCFILSFGLKSNLLLLIYRLLILFLMFELGGRGPILSLVVVMFLFYFLRFVISLKLNMKFKINFKTIMFFSSILIVLIFYSQEIFTTIFDEINFQRFFSFDTYKDDESVLVRANYLRKGYESILEHPFFGMGIGSSGLILESNDIVIYPHNLFVEAFMELGFMGAFSYLFLYLIFFFSNISLIKTNKNLLLLFLISLIYFMEDNKSNSFDSWRVSIIWIMMFIIEKKKHLLSQNDFDSELI